jgi:tetratricopeptide (TPR) repeat protein
MGDRPRRQSAWRSRGCTAAIAMVIVAHAVPGFAGKDQRSAGEMLDFAKSAPCSVALRIYGDLAADTTTADSLRTIAAGLNADALFAAGDFRAAREAYVLAARGQRNTAYHHHRAGLAALKAGDTVSARSLFRQSIECGDAEYSNRSRVMLGDLLCTAGEYGQAMELFLATGSFSAKNSWAVPAFIGKLTCAKKLGLADSAEVYDRLLSLYAKTMLEKERYARVRKMPLAKQANNTGPDTAPVSQPDRDSRFTLQVGAFGSRDRARELQKNLSKKFTGVTCSTGIVSNRTYYRVWVGEFASREQAEDFGRNRLSAHGHEYRIVVRQ